MDGRKERVVIIRALAKGHVCKNRTNWGPNSRIAAWGEKEALRGISSFLNFWSWILISNSRKRRRRGGLILYGCFLGPCLSPRKILR
jgi:hypothetical protein